MAQLSDDCFAFGGPMMSVDEAIAIITSRVKAIDELETVALVDADNRIVAKDVVAPLPLPPFMNSAVDGYAVSGADMPWATDRILPVEGRVQAGGSIIAARPGHAVRIFTGAPMPEGTDTVFMQEDVKVDDAGRVVLPAGLKSGANVRPSGEDVPLGAVAIKSGARLRPQDVAVAAAFGLTTLNVVRRPRVAVFSTGNELATPGGTRSNSQLFDSNRVMLMAMLRRLGCEVGDLGILRDDRHVLTSELKKAAKKYDLILTTGGVSTGEEDHVKAAVDNVGSLVLWRMAIKPGRPVAMGIIDGTPLIGLPGNPVASFVTFVHVVRPTVLALAGGTPLPLKPIPVRAAFSYKKKIARREYVRVTLRKAADGAMEAIKFPREGAGLISSLLETDGLAELAEETVRVEQGDTVNFLSYADML